MATTSSGLTVLFGSLPVRPCTSSCTAGMRVEPPTMITWCSAPLVTPASFIAFSNGILQRSMRSAVMSWNLARVRVSSMWSGPLAVAVMNGRLIWVCCTCDRSILAFSAASFRRCAGHLVLGQVDAVGGLELVNEPVNDALVPVVAAEVGVAVGGLHFEHAVTDFEHRHVKRAAAEVEHEDRLVVRAPCRGRRRAPLQLAR